MSNIKECIRYLIESELHHYIEHVTSEFPDLLLDGLPLLESLNEIIQLTWIKTNVETVNHIYMRARLAEEEFNDTQ